VLDVELDVENTVEVPDVNCPVPPNDVVVLELPEPPVDVRSALESESELLLSEEFPVEF